MIKRIAHYYAARWLRDVFGIHLTPRQAYQQDYLQSPRWRLLRHLARVRDGWRCRECGSYRRLQTHHTSYVHRGEPGVSGFLFELMTIETLCADCHKQQPRNPDKGE